MSGFDAATAVNSLDYDFTACPREDGAGQLDAKGIVPEPTEARIAAFSQAVNEIAREAAAKSKVLTDAAEKALETGEVPELPERLDDDSYAKVRVALADFCAGSPSAEDIAQIPPRILGAFCRWIMTELNGPKG